VELTWAFDDMRSPGEFDMDDYVQEKPTFFTMEDYVSLGYEMFGMNRNGN